MADAPHQGQVAGTHWEPSQYLKFSDHRLRPALDLLAHIPLDAPHVIYDLGCGSGNVTRLLAERWPSATVYGVDQSPEMLVQAASQLSSIHWVEADIRSWQPDAPPDLIYSNAALHWVDGHHELFCRLIGSINPGGGLAVQMPLSWSMPSHRLMRETLADSGPGGTPLGDAALRSAVAHKWVEEVEFYYDLLLPYSHHLDIWATEYLHCLSGDDPVLEWVKSTGLRPILNGLSDADRDAYLAVYRQRLRDCYPRRPDGHTLYPFHRLFIVALTSAR